MTDFELAVWAACFAARWDRDMDIPGMKEEQAAGQAFESATYAVQELRKLKIEPVFGEGTGEAGVIEKYVLSQLRGKAS